MNLHTASRREAEPERSAVRPALAELGERRVLDGGNRGVRIEDRGVGHQAVVVNRAAEYAARSVGSACGFRV